MTTGTIAMQTLPGGPLGPSWVWDWEKWVAAVGHTLGLHHGAQDWHTRTDIWAFGSVGACHSPLVSS